MKLTVAFLVLAAAAQTPAFAQSFHPRSGHGHRHGGHSSHHHHGHGRHHHHRHSSFHVGVGFYSPYYYAPYRYPVYSAYRYPVYGYGYPYPVYSYSAPVSSRAATGMMLGTIAGAAIGHNSSSLHHDAWAGAAIGAASGWLLGSVADSRAAARERDRAARSAETAPVPASTVSTASAPTAQTTDPQTVIINNNYYGSASPMSSANSMFGR